MASDSTAKPSARNSHLPWAAALIISAFACLALIAPLASLPFRVARNFNEGWNAYWAMAAASGGQLYPAMTALTSNNYPPVSFFVLGFLGHAPADPILAGRVLAFASLLLVTINVVIWLLRNGVRTSLSLLSGAAFIITMDAVAPGYVAQNDPQWFAHALMTTGMLILWRQPHSSARLASAATLITLGGWVKQLLIPLPIALALWLYNNNRRAFWRWLALLGLLGLVFSALTIAGYGHDVIDGILWAPRRISLKRPFMVARSALPPLIPFLCFAAMLCRSYRTSSAARFALNYLAIALAVAAVACTGDGVWVNAAFDIAIAGALATGMALERITAELTENRRKHPVQISLSLGAVAIFSFWTVSALSSNVERLDVLQSRIAATNTEIEFLRHHDAHNAACESLALCFWAGSPFNLDFFNYGQKLKTGRVPLEICSRLFDGTRYTVIHMYSAPTAPDALLPPRCVRDITQHYELARTSTNGFFLLPRAPRKAASTGPPLLAKR